MEGESFYVYAHMRPDLTPFYIGKGTKERARNLKARNPHHGSVVAKYGKQNVLVEMIQCRSEAEAFQREQIVIRALRSAGVELTNKTEGGEGVRGHVHSEEARIKISLAGIGRRPTDETKQLISARHSGKRLTEEHRQKLSQAWKSRPPMTDETRAKIAAGQRLRPPPSDETRAAISRAKTGVKQSQQHRANSAAAHRGKSLTAETRAKMSKAMQGRVIAPEHREKISNAVRAAWRRRKEQHGR